MCKHLNDEQKDKKKQRILDGTKREVSNRTKHDALRGRQSDASHCNHAYWMIGVEAIDDLGASV